MILQRRPEIVIFLGPSLPLTLALELLPDGGFLPPVRCGDVLGALRLGPRIIAIIDGAFEHTAAVWHKEILLALERGVSVYGASSMGALRAAELADFGMQGVGHVYHDYHSGKILDDDEVAILHGPESVGYMLTTTAMVNVRATARHAVEEEIVSEDVADQIVACAKQLFYQDRTLDRACAAAIHQGADSATIGHFLAWSARGGYVDQKRRDAIALLEHLATSVGPAPDAPEIHRTALLCGLQQFVMCRPFSYDRDWLPIREKVAREARLLGKSYLQCRRLAYLLAAADGLADGSPVEAGDNRGYDFRLAQIRDDPGWAADHDCSAEEKDEFVERMRRIARFVAAEDHAVSAQAFAPEDFLMLLMRLSGDYGRYREKVAPGKSSSARQAEMRAAFAEEEPCRYSILFSTAYVWRAVDSRATRLRLVPSTATLREFSDQFRRDQGLLTREASGTWMERNEIDIRDYNHMLLVLCRFDFLVYQGNLDGLGGGRPPGDAWWLMDAMRLTGLYGQARGLLLDPEERRRVRQKLRVREISDLEIYTNMHDFTGGVEELLLTLEGRADPLAPDP